MEETDQNLEIIANNLGRIIGNLLSLELLLRLFLHNVDLKRYGFPPPEVNLDKITEGEMVSENYLCNYDSLRGLVKKYNSIVNSQSAPDLCVDNTIVNLRDAFAHGRVIRPLSSAQLQLYKFGKPTKNRQVLLEYKTSLTKPELDDCVLRSFQQIMKVEESCKRFCPSALR